jgi:hypothetical protein
MLKTIEIFDLDDEPEEIYSATTICSNKKASKKIKNDYSQDDVMSEFAQEDQLEPDNEEEEDEIDRYVKAKLIFKSDESVISWWKKWSINYPKLSMLARSLFGIPASSCSSERIFSAAGRILEERRQNLNDDTVDDILFIRNFKKLVL